MLALACPTQRYDWGSAHAIPEFLDEPVDGNPVAEVWIGTHPLGTARIIDDDPEVLVRDGTVGAARRNHEGPVPGGDGAFGVGHLATATVGFERAVPVV